MPVSWAKCATPSRHPQPNTAMTGSVMAGQVAGMLHEIKPLHQIFEELQAGCEKRLAELEK